MMSGAACLHWSNLFLTGRPGTGKTTLLFRALRERGVRLGGFCVKRVYRRASLDGMDMIDLATLRRARMVTFESGGRQGPGLTVHRGAFLEIGAPSLLAALECADVIVMDELGRFECGLVEFTNCVFAALNAPKPVVGVLKDESNPFLDEVRARRDVRVLRLDRDSRDEVGREFRSLLLDLLAY